jgi:hypothetical protein
MPRHARPRHTRSTHRQRFFFWHEKPLSSAIPLYLLFFFSLFLFLLTKEIPGALLAGF